MAAVHEGLATHGDAVFSHRQTHGKGQRGKVWQSSEGLNIALSIILKPIHLRITHPFQLSAAIALGVFDFVNRYAGEQTTIKWPNDIYWRDRKAGGILIENVISGSKWKWAVAGIGLNINQTEFNDTIRNAVSLKQITGKDFDVEKLAAELHQLIMLRTQTLLTRSYDALLKEYEEHLYKRNCFVKLKKSDIIFETQVKGITPEGRLFTQDIIDNEFEFGEIEWML